MNFNEYWVELTKNLTESKNSVIYTVCPDSENIFSFLIQRKESQQSTLLHTLLLLT